MRKNRRSIVLPACGWRRARVGDRRLGFTAIGPLTMLWLVIAASSPSFGSGGDPLGAQLEATRQALMEAGDVRYDYVFEGPRSTADQPNRFEGEFRGTVMVRPAMAQHAMIFHATIDGRLRPEDPRTKLTLATDGTEACALDHIERTFTCGDVSQGARGLLGMAAYVVMPEFAIPDLFDQALKFPKRSRLDDRVIGGVESAGVRLIDELRSGTRDVSWWFGRDDHLPRQQIWIDRLDGLEGRMRFTIESLEIGLDLPDSAFRIDPPADVAVVRDPGPFIAPGKTAPEFRVTTATGEALSLSRLRGRPVLLYFWMPACGYCKAIEPQMLDLAARLRSRDLPVETIGINIVPMARQQLEKFLPPEEMGMKLVLEPGDVATDFRVVATPTLTLIDATGVIRFHVVGAAPDDVATLSRILQL